MIQDFPEELLKSIKDYRREVPPLVKTQVFVDNMIDFLFPLRKNRHIGLDQIEVMWGCLQVDFSVLLEPLKPVLKETATVIQERFFDAIPGIHRRLLEEADTFIKCDPAANCIEEVILCYPGFYAIAVHRFANELYRLGIPILPRTMSEHAHSKTGIDIHPGATIGKYFYIDHGTGIVIGETTQIGDHVKIYQGVTLGAIYVERDLRHVKRHPTIEDNVIIYAGSTILGGETVIGQNTIIGGNVWLTESVAPNSVVYHKADIVIREGANNHVTKTGTNSC